MTIKKTQLHKFIYLSNVYIYMSAKKEEKTNETIAFVNEPKFNEKNTTKFSTDNNNFNERTNNALNQQQDAINNT